MLRFILKRTTGDAGYTSTGVVHRQTETVDIDVPELERVLVRNDSCGGSCFDFTELIGVEVLPKKQEDTP